MIDVEEEALESTLMKAIQGLGSSDSRLVSFTRKINSFNPLHFFEAAYHLQMNRSFWMSTIDNFTMVGIGTAYSIKVKEDEMDLIDAKWKKLLDEAVIHNPYLTPGTGIAAIGGMAFDPRKPQTELWQGFSKNELRIPTFMLVTEKDSSYLTTSVFLSGTDNPNDMATKLAEQEKALLTHYKRSSQKPSILQQEAVEPVKWKETVEQATEYITKGKAEKIVLARELRLRFTENMSITEVLKDLVETQPTSYIFALEQGDACFIGATPERLVRVENNQLLSTCLAGTAPRGATEIEDKKIGYQLLHDDKNLQEHDFVVQMIKHSVEEFCENMEIPDKPVLYKLRNLQHLYTPVRGEFKDGYSIFDVIKKLHPTPALGGEPREAALAFIRENELLDRGWYGAPIGWVDSNQNGEFAVAIRSGLVRGKQASLFAGCGVVQDSDPEAEFEETRIKFLPMLTVLGG